MKKVLELYFSKDIKNDSELFVFNTIDELTHKINSFGLKDSLVFLTSIDVNSSNVFFTEILVSQNYPIIREFIENIYDSMWINFKVHFQMYENYEDAYEVAKMIKRDKE